MRSLLVTASPLAPADAIAAAAAGASPPAVATRSASLVPSDLPHGFFDAVLSVAPAGGHSAPLLRLLVGALAPGGRLELREEGGVSRGNGGGRGEGVRRTEGFVARRLPGKAGV